MLKPLIPFEKDVMIPAVALELIGAPENSCNVMSKWRWHTMQTNWVNNRCIVLFKK